MRARMRETAITYGAAAAAKRKSVLRNFAACFFRPLPLVFPFFRFSKFSASLERKEGKTKYVVVGEKKEKNGEKTSPSTSSLLPRWLERFVISSPLLLLILLCIFGIGHTHSISLPFSTPKKSQAKKIRLLFFFFEENTGSGGGKRQIRRRLGGGAEGKREGIFFSPSSSNGSSPKKRKSRSHLPMCCTRELLLLLPPLPSARNL